MTKPTPAQIEANRRNAQLSTGPRTSDGKAAASLNAAKHGILSRQLIVQGRHFQESAEEFQDFWAEYHQHLVPVGPLEEMLVDQIVALNWRLRRVRAAESGQIALSVDDGCKHRARPGAEDAGCDNLIKNHLLDLRKKIELGGELTRADVDTIIDYDERAHPLMINQLEILLTLVSANSFGLDARAFRERNQQKCLETLDEELRKLSDRLDRSEFKEQAHRNSDLIPRADIVEKILRYETALDRQLFRAIEQLDRLQTRRLGDKIPPPPVAPAPAPV